MLKINIKNILAVILILLINSGYAQTSKTDHSDTQGWYGASATIDLPKKWQIETEYQSRFINNLQTYNGSYFTLGASKKLNKHFELMGDYRLALVNKGTYRRFAFGGELSNKYKKLQLAIRAQIQNQLQDFDDVTKDSQKSGYWRIRFGGKYSFTKKIEAYASIEPIMKFASTTFLDNIRNTIGVKYKVVKNVKLDMFYIFRPDYAKATYNRTFHIVGFNVDYTFHKKKKKKKKK